MSLLTSDYVSDWYLARLKKPYNPFGNKDSYYLLKSITNNTSLSAQPADLIQGEAGTLVIDQQEQKEITTISSEALILNNSSGVNNVDTNTENYFDVIDLFKYDYYELLKHFFLTPEDLFIQQSDLQTLGITLSQFGEAIDNTNLLSSASINMGDTVNVSLTYQTRYDNKFEIVYVEDFYASPAKMDFIGRVARNYDCRFYIDGQDYRIKSGSISVNVSYSELWLANTYTKLPFYSPQKYTVSGSIELIGKHYEYNSLVSEGNCSILIGDRYIELGQANIKNNYERSLTASNAPTTVKIDFQVYARLGAGLDSVRWAQYYIDKLNNPTSKLYDNISKLDILNILNNLTNWENKP